MDEKDEMLCSDKDEHPGVISPYDDIKAQILPTFIDTLIPDFWKKSLSTLKLLSSPRHTESQQHLFLDQTDPTYCTVSSVNKLSNNVIGSCGTKLDGQNQLNTLLGFYKEINAESHIHTSAITNELLNTKPENQLNTTIASNQTKNQFNTVVLNEDLRSHVEIEEGSKASSKVNTEKEMSEGKARISMKPMQSTNNQKMKQTSNIPTNDFFTKKLQMSTKKSSNITRTFKVTVDAKNNGMRKFIRYPNLFEGATCTKPNKMDRIMAPPLHSEDLRNVLNWRKSRR